MRDSNSLHCLLDDDADAVRLARRRRVRSLAVSIAVQALFITTVIVAPLLASGKLQLAQPQVPLPIYFGLPGPAELKPKAQTGGGTRQQRPKLPFDANTQPPSIPKGVPKSDPETPGIGGEVGEGVPTCPNCSLDSQLRLTPPPTERTAPPPPTDPRPATSQRVRVTTSLQEAMLVNKVTPQYPPLCRQMRLEGEIVLRAIISREGTVQELAYVSGPACFLQFSMNAVAQWRYRPTLLNGQPVEVETTIRVVFRLNR